MFEEKKLNSLLGLIGSIRNENEKQLDPQSKKTTQYEILEKLAFLNLHVSVKSAKRARQPLKQKIWD